MRTVYNVRRGLAVCFLMCGFMVCAPAQKSTLTFKNGRATVTETIRPRREADAHLYPLKLRKGQRVKIKVEANSVYLAQENECSVYFQLFDDKGEAVFIGDSMVGIDEWGGEIERSAGYNISIAMHCVEGFTAGQLRKKKPTFKYSLRVQMK